jgi:hypothetical protein
LLVRVGVDLLVGDDGGIAGARGVARGRTVGDVLRGRRGDGGLGGLVPLRLLGVKVDVEPGIGR